MRSSLRTRYPSGQAVLNPEPKSDAQKTIGFSPGHEKRCEFRRIVTVPKPPYLSAIRPYPTFPTKYSDTDPTKQCGALHSGPRACGDWWKWRANSETCCTYEAWVWGEKFLTCISPIMR